MTLTVCSFCPLDSDGVQIISVFIGIFVLSPKFSPFTTSFRFDSTRTNLISGTLHVFPVRKFSTTDILMLQKTKHEFNKCFVARRSLVGGRATILFGCKGEMLGDINIVRVCFVGKKIKVASAKKTLCSKLPATTIRLQLEGCHTFSFFMSCRVGLYTRQRVKRVTFNCHHQMRTYVHA